MGFSPAKHVELPWEVQGVGVGGWWQEGGAVEGVAVLGVLGATSARQHPLCPCVTLASASALAGRETSPALLQWSFWEARWETGQEKSVVSPLGRDKGAAEP